ncbi:MAG: DUF192 domain-containing protein [Pseudomonadota bacterium]
MVWALTSVSAHAACGVDVVDLRGDWGQVQFRVEIADSHEERAQGLMHRESLPLMSGMLFIYERPGNLSFWMRNTLIPLDMIFVDQAGIVQAVHANAIPGDETAISGGQKNLAVLEINGGLAAQLRIAPGSQLRHPQMPQNLAAWPCE